jgi:hypothetical protein
MLFIKNNTPYNGKIKLTFERFPHYTGKSILNKVYLNLGFTKLVSRMHPNRSFDWGWEVNKEKAAKISYYTGGTIKTYEWWEVRGTGGVFKSNTAPKNKKDIVYHGKLENSFMYGDIYLGSIKAGWWYYQNRLVVCQKYPKGVAIKLKKDSYHSNDFNFEDIEGIYGFSHRGGCLFKPGDKLFDEDYIACVKDYPKKEWDRWHDKYRKNFAKASAAERRQIANDGVKAYIPFKERGKKIIETWDEAMDAANNLSKYLS